MIDGQARKRIQALEERAARRGREVADFSKRLARGAADFARLAAMVEAITNAEIRSRTTARSGSAFAQAYAE
jgi:uncharacterized coiled-coil protein SlyX